jgi:hypothetical protein
LDKAVVANAPLENWGVSIGDKEMEIMSPVLQEMIITILWSYDMCTVVYLQ